MNNIERSLSALTVAFLFSFNCSAQHAPIISGIADQIELSCGDDIPFADIPSINPDPSCNVVMVEVMDKALCSSYMEYDMSVPNFFDPGYAFGLWLPSLPGGLTDNYLWDANRAKLFASDENAIILGEVYDENDPSIRFEVFQEFDQGVNWNGWHSQMTTTPPVIFRSFKDDSGFAVYGGDLFEDWQYYVMDASTSYIDGLMSRAGDATSVSHAPQSLYFGFQLGQAANNVDDGLGCNVWGVVNGTVGSEAIATAHTLTASLTELGTIGSNYCDDLIIRTYKVTDDCGNISRKSQLISFSGTVGFPGDINGDGLIDVSDFLNLNSAWGLICTNCPEDLNGDGVVDVDDFLLFNSLFSADCN